VRTASLQAITNPAEHLRDGLKSVQHSFLSRYPAKQKGQQQTYKVLLADEVGD
jgi:hypothetical protein